MELLQAVSADRQPLSCVTHKTVGPSHSETANKSINSNYNEEIADIVKGILISKTEISDKPSLFR